VLGQISVNPTVSPTLNSGGWVYGAAVLLGILGILFTLAVVFGYMRLAPRFQTDEETRKRVRVPRMQPGKEVRRPVNVSGVPLLVQAPVVAVASAAAAQGLTTLAAPTAVPMAPPAPVAVATAPQETTAPVAQGAAASAPAAPAPAAEAAALAPTPAPAAGEHKDVALDQETFDRVLAELLDKGTDRRVAEGQARRAAMIAARKKAEG
jgi:hypothetical protein